MLALIIGFSVVIHEKDRQGIDLFPLYSALLLGAELLLVVTTDAVLASMVRQGHRLRTTGAVKIKESTEQNVSAGR